MVGSDPPALITPLGSENLYGYSVGSVSGTTNSFLTDRVDQYGRTLEHFNYQTISGVIKLTSVVDIDGQTNTLTYGDSSFPNLITAVTDRYGRTAYFNYNGSGVLTNSVDAQGMATYYQYDSSDEITNMVTLYGTNNFQYYTAGGTNTALERSLLVTEASGDQQLYVYRDDPPIDFGDMASYHWNRAQYAYIRADWQADGISMPNTDYEVATVKHFLHGANTTSGGYTLSDTYDQIRDPYDPIIGARPNQIAYTYLGQNGRYIGDNTSGGLQRVTSISINGHELVGITVNSLGRPTSYTYFNNFGPNAIYTNVFDSTGSILQSELGPDGELTRGYGYTSGLNGTNNLLIAVTNAVGDVTYYTHDPATLNVTSISFPGGLIRTNLYYSSGPYKNFLAMQADIGFKTNYFTYTNGNVLMQTNELGLVTVNTYDNLNRILSTAFPDGTTVSNIYDKLDIVATKDRLNQWTYFGYNAVRQLMLVTNVNNQVTTFDYCGCGSPDEINQWDGTSWLVTLFDYNMGGLLTNVVYPDGYQLSYTYDSNDRVQTITDGAGNQLSPSWYQHGLQNELLYVGLDGQRLLSQQFDSYGRVLQSEDRNSVTVTNGYDFLDRVVARQYLDVAGTPQSGLELLGYGSLGLTNYVDQLGHHTFFNRDSEGRIIVETNANNEVLQFAYNPDDELLSLTDGKNQMTRWNYDSYGRVTNKLDNSGITNFVYQYDVNDRMTNRWTPAKGPAIYRYDPIGNLTNVDYSGGANFTPSISFAYDSLNRLTKMLDGIGSTVFTWTPGNQLASEAGPWANDKVNYSYNNARQRSIMSLLQPNATPWTQTYGYDTMMRLASVTSPSGGSFTSPSGTFSYYYSDGMDRPYIVYMPTDESYNYCVYDSLARPTYSYAGASQTYQQLQYAYDPGSEMTQQVFTANNFINYSYDNIGQLKTAQGFEQSGQSRLQEQFGYAYDKAWNLSDRTNNALIENFTVNNVNELSSMGQSGSLTVAGTTMEGNSNYVANGVYSVTVNGVNATTYLDGGFAATGFTPVNGQNTYTAIALDGYGRISTNSVTVSVSSTNGQTYDLNGNLTSDGVRNFAYDDENQLVGVWVVNVWSNSFAYDGVNRKRIEGDYTWTGSSWRETNEVHYVYDGNLVFQERDGNNMPVTTYTRGNDLSSTLQGAGGIGGLLARSDRMSVVPVVLSPQNPNPQNVVNSYYFNDAEGNVTALASPNGVLLAQYEYDPYGNVISMGGLMASENKYRFASKEWNDDIGLYYYLYRFYDPNLQRWINRDPIKEWGGINQYEYVGNNPVSNVDPYGLQEEERCLFRTPYENLDPESFDAFGNETRFGADWSPKDEAKADDVTGSRQLDLFGNASAFDENGNGLRNDNAKFEGSGEEPKSESIYAPNGNQINIIPPIDNTPFFSASYQLAGVLSDLDDNKEDIERIRKNIEAADAATADMVYQRAKNECPCK